MPTSDVRGVSETRLLLWSNRSSAVAAEHHWKWFRGSGDTSSRAGGGPVSGNLTENKSGDPLTSDAHFSWAKYLWRPAAALADTRLNGCGGGAPSEGITWAGRREKSEVKARFWEEEREGTRLQVARRELVVKAGHAGFSGRWSERRVAALNGETRRSSEHTSPTASLPLYRQLTCPGGSRANPDR